MSTLAVNTLGLAVAIVALASIGAVAVPSSGTEIRTPTAGYAQGWETSSGACLIPPQPTSCSIDGWTRSTSFNNIEIVDGGGNPGSYLHSFGSGGITGADARQVDELRGDFGGRVWRMSVDLRFFSGGFRIAGLRFRYRDGRFNGWVFTLADSFPSGWQTFEVIFDGDWTDAEARAAGWLPDHEWDPPSSATPPPSFRETLSEVYYVEIRIRGGGMLHAGIDNVRLYEVARVTRVAIDIKPGSDPNSLNPRSRGLIPVAILGSDGFDVTTVDVGSLRFGPLDAAPAHRGHLEDVDSDGDLDRSVHFSTWLSGIECGQTEARLGGETLDGTPIEGADAIRTVGCRFPGP